MAKFKTYQDYLTSLKKQDIVQQIQQAQAAPSAPALPETQISLTYKKYIEWLIAQNINKVRATDLLMQLKFINDHILFVTQRNSYDTNYMANQAVVSALSEFFKSRTSAFNRIIEKYAPLSVEEFKRALMPIAVVGAMAMVGAYTFLKTASGLSEIAASLILPASAFTPLIIYLGFKALSWGLNKLITAFSHPLDKELGSETQKDFNLEVTKTLFEKPELNEVSTEYQMVKKTTLAMYHNIFPKREWSEVTSLKDDEVDLKDLSGKLSGKSP